MFVSTRRRGEELPKPQDRGSEGGLSRLRGSQHLFGSKGLGFRVYRVYGPVRVQKGLGSFRVYRSCGLLRALKVSGTLKVACFGGGGVLLFVCRSTLMHPEESDY